MNKPGYKTTEFWATAIAAVIPLLNQAFGWNMPTEAIVAVAGSVAAYALSRGTAKKVQ